MKRVITLFLFFYLPQIMGFESWCQSLALRRAIKPYSFSYILTIKDAQENDIAATRCFVFLTEQEKQILRNTLNMVSSDTQLRSITTVKDSLLALFGQQVMHAKGESATVQDALTYLKPVEEGA